MANIALVGATGNIGARVLDEALSRGHRVTGTTRRPDGLPARERLTAALVDTKDTTALAGVLKGHDAIIVSVRWTENDIAELIEAVRQSGVKRALFVVGAGSLIRADGRLHFDHMPNPPPTSKPAMLALDALRKVDDFDWTAISPAATIQPGQRTGKFRLGGDHMVVDAAGNSLISREDFAIAILDEIEKPGYIRQRFTAAY